MAFCTECGRKLTGDDKFCPSCGLKIGEEVITVSTTDSTSTISESDNGIAIAGFICAIFGLNIIGLILSAIGISNANKNGGKNKGLAIAGVIISCIRLVISIIIIIAWFYTVVYYI